jgi:lysozyme family protein
MKNGFLIGFASAVVLLVVITFSNTGASFRAYAPKLLKFEGKGYGIHQPIWGYRKFSKSEALDIHKHHYWNRYHGNLFDNQAVAEVLIDHLINAGDGRTKQNIKAFEKIIGANPDGIISQDDVYLANTIEDPNWLVNQYVDYRVSYYRSLKNKKYQAGWLKRANSFRVYENETLFASNTETDIVEEEEDVVVLNPKKVVQINGEQVGKYSKIGSAKHQSPSITEEQTDIIEDLN